MNEIYQSNVVFFYQMHTPSTQTYHTDLWFCILIEHPIIGDVTWAIRRLISPATNFCYSKVVPSLVKIVGESSHSWPKHRYSRQAIYNFFSYMLLPALKHLEIDENARRCLRWISWLWRYDVTQTHIMTSFWRIILRTFLSWSRVIPRRRQVDYHSLRFTAFSLISL